LGRLRCGGGGGAAAQVCRSVQCRVTLVDVGAGFRDDT
jgi:hypothetical protein